MTNDLKDTMDDLGLLFADASDMTDAEVALFLRKAGIDLDAGQRRFDALLDDLFASAAVAEQLPAGRRPNAALLSRMESYVRGLGKSTAELLRDLQAHDFVAAHRDFKSVTREDLESQLAELLAIEAAARGEEQ